MPLPEETDWGLAATIAGSAAEQAETLARGLRSQQRMHLFRQFYYLQLATADEPLTWKQAKAEFFSKESIDA